MRWIPDWAFEIGEVAFIAVMAGAAMVLFIMMLTNTR